MDRAERAESRENKDREEILCRPLESLHVSFMLNAGLLRVLSRYAWPLGLPECWPYWSRAARLLPACVRVLVVIVSKLKVCESMCLRRYICWRLPSRCNVATISAMAAPATSPEKKGRP